MEEKNYRVLRIEEQLYGCEELPEGQPVLCDVLLEAADGTQRVLPYPDAELTRLDINEGSTVTHSSGGVMGKELVIENEIVK